MLLSHGKACGVMITRWVWKCEKITRKSGVCELMKPKARIESKECLILHLHTFIYMCTPILEYM